MRRLLNLLFRRSRLEHDLHRELRYHLERRADALAQSGVSPAEARRRAALELGGLAQTQEEVRDSWFSRSLQEFARDLDHAARALRRNPAFTSVALLSLALGIGANAAIFGAFYAVLVRPLPYGEPDRLLWLTLATREAPDGFVLTPEFAAWRAASRTFEKMTAWNDEQFNLTGAGSPERIAGASVTSEFLAVLGVRPSLGRDFTPADDTPGADSTALLSHALWQRRFGGDPSVAGRIVMLNDKPCAVIGVLPRGFRFPGGFDPEILVAARIAGQPVWNAETMGLLRVVGRLAPGATPRGAAAELSAIHAANAPDMPERLRTQRRDAAVRAIPLQQHLVGATRPVFLVLLGATGLLLLIACVNVANLQLARAAARRREIGLRVALGAGRARIARALVIENLLLSALSGLAGLLVAGGLLRLLSLFPDLPLRDAGVQQVSWPIGVAALALATLCGLAIGLVPALAGPRVDLNDVLKSGSRALLGGGGTRVRSVLVASEVALAVILLLGAGLLLRSLRNVLLVDSGFDSRNVLTLRVNLPGSRYAEAPRRAEFTRALVERAGALPGVVAAGATNSLPLTGYSLGMFFQIEGRPQPSGAAPTGAAVMTVTPDYFRAIGIRLLAGRGFDERDAARAAPVAIVNAGFARRHFSSMDVIGKRLRFAASPDAATIVGVVADVRHGGREKEPEPHFYLPAAQLPPSRVNLAVRAAGDPSALAAALRSAVWTLDKDLPVYDVSTMEERLSRAGEARTSQTLLLSLFALLAMSLAGIGVYGVVAESVRQRAGEIGLRMALGAAERDVRRMVLRRCLVLALAGVAAGSAVGLWLVRFFAPLLYEVRPADPATFAAVAAGLLAMALVAGYLPARRASRIAPLDALRCE